MKITIVHLDLGIGGAERLIVNIGVALKEMGHDVSIVTSHHDQGHSFEETKVGGKSAQRGIVGLLPCVFRDS
jgi:alpha-1,3/alpha-1,6-mannosyltransferase